MIHLGRPLKIHIIGVAGSVMGGLACVLAEQGHRVSGSDRDCYPPMSDRLAAAGISVTLGFSARNVLDDPPDVVVVGNIARRDNPEAVAARGHGGGQEEGSSPLVLTSLPEILGGLILRDRRPLTVAGTHGKTTTTSMLVWLLRAAGADPGFMIGGVPQGFDRGFVLGTGRHFVLEADEYDTAYFDKRPKFVHYLPEAGVLTHLEFDHADIYPDEAEVRRAFRTYARLFPKGAPLWVFGGVPDAVEAARSGSAAVRIYALEGEVRDAATDALASEVALGTGLGSAARFRFRLDGEDLGVFELPMAGLHNIRNATAALALALNEGVGVEDARAALATFPGVRRRQELVGAPRGITVIQDYAHHPTAVRETVAAIRAGHPGGRLVALFEAESNTSRRRVFQEAYARAFDGADEVIFVRPLEKDDKLPPEQRLDPERLAADLQSSGVPSRFLPEPERILEVLLGELQPGDVALFMSGRDFLGLPRALVERLEG